MAYESYKSNCKVGRLSMYLDEGMLPPMCACAEHALSLQAGLYKPLSCQVFEKVTAYLY